MKEIRYGLVKAKIRPHPQNTKVILYAEDSLNYDGLCTKNLAEAFPDRDIIITGDRKPALEAVRDKIGRLELVITDERLRTSNGWDLAQDLRNMGYQSDIYLSCSEFDCLKNSMIPKDFRQLFAGYVCPLQKYSIESMKTELLGKKQGESK